jgi:hypothetical protein
MGRRRDWNKVREIDAKIKELGLYYREGADRFGIDVGVLYEYSRRQNKKSSGSDSTTTKWTARTNLYWPAGACSQDWGSLPTAKTVFVCDSIIGWWSSLAAGDFGPKIQQVARIHT